MPIEAQYETFYAIKPVHYSFSWGGTSYCGSSTNGMLVKEFLDEYIVNTDRTSTSTIRFIYPRFIAPAAYLDGVADGHFTLYNSGATTTISNFQIEIRKTDDTPSNEETLGYYSYTFSEQNTIGTGSYLTIPFFIIIDAKKIEENEKLLIYLTFVSANNLEVCHANDSSDIDFKINIPFAIE